MDSVIRIYYDNRQDTDLAVKGIMKPRCYESFEVVVVVMVVMERCRSVQRKSHGSRVMKKSG